MEGYGKSRYIEIVLRLFVERIIEYAEQDQQLATQRSRGIYSDKFCMSFRANSSLSKVVYVL